MNIEYSKKAVKYIFIKKLVLAWDPDFTKITPAERRSLEEAEADIAENGTISHDAINWD